MEPTQSKSKNIVPAVIVVIVIILALVFGFMKYAKKGTDTAVVIPTPTPVVVPNTNSYKDGTYTADGNYVAPSGAESISVEVVLKDGIITDAKIAPHATNPTSLGFQKTVSANIKQYVVGKSIADVKLDKVSGSSLTPKAWNDAVAKILVQAKA